MSKRIAIIANPHAGKGDVARTLQEAKRALWGYAVDIRFPESLAALHETCATLDPQIYEAVVVIGGDGTINQAIRGLARNQVPLYVFPGGTANDLARELGIRADWEQAQRLIVEKRTETIDLIEVDQVPFATVAGIGVGAFLTAEFNQRRQSSAMFRTLSRNLKSQVYTFLSAKTILTHWNPGHHLHVRAGTFDEKIKTAAVFICNQSQLGGDLTVTPRAIRNSDQRFSVLIVPSGNSFGLARALISLKLGIIPEDYISFSTDRVQFRDLRGKPIRVFGDGEILTENPVLDFRVVPRALRVYRAGANEGGHVA